MSTSLAPPSCASDSAGTPWGLHRIAAAIGAGEPAGTVFLGRKPVARNWRTPNAGRKPANRITTRILWLEGLEPGLNRGPGADSFRRYIYLHGTNYEERIATPASGGCVQLTNCDMLALFSCCPVGTGVRILLTHEGSRSRRDP